MTLDYWKLLAGLGIFLFGMQLLENGIKDLSGRAFRKIIRHYTDTRIKAILNGTLVSAVLQSSSAVSLMVLAFVGAGIMQMENAIGVILGSNIGTTLTAWIVATLGFKISIEAFALPFMAAGAVGLIFFRPGSRPHHLTRLVMGFGFLFLGLDYMKTSVDDFSRHFDPHLLQGLPSVVYVGIGLVLTAVMQASAATIAITLTALNSGLMTFDMAAAMVIGANVGTTVTILLGAIGGTSPKKRVAASHLAFNLLTGIVAFAAMPGMIRIIGGVVDLTTDGPMGLALFHTLFNVGGVLLFLPFIPVLTRWLARVVPDRRPVLNVYLDDTPAEEIDAAAEALKNEVAHLFQECRLYMLRSLQIDDRLIFEERLPFELQKNRKLTLEQLYDSIKLLHSNIISYYARIQTHQMDPVRTRELERVILASRNIMNAVKNFKGIRLNLEEFETSDARYLNRQYDRFRRRLVGLFHDMTPLFADGDEPARLAVLLVAIRQVELEDNQFIHSTIQAAATNEIHQEELATLFLVNRLFSQACRMLIFSKKDLLLGPENKAAFDRALEL